MSKKSKREISDDPMCKYRRRKIAEKKSGESEGPEFSLSEIEGAANREFLFRRPDL